MPNPSNQLPDWPRAHGEPLFSGRIRRIPEEFEVTEVLGWDPSGDGEHDFLRVQKTGQNTAWVAAQLASHAGVAERDVGYSGLKDRNAVTRQWFTVRRPSGKGTDWDSFDADGVILTDIRRHRRKLKRGVHRTNEFRIVVHGADTDPIALNDRLTTISEDGIPNYFGPQRFGHEGRNLALAQAFIDGRKMNRQQRSIAISAARSFLFNEVLAERVRNQTWNRGVPGDCFNLDGTNSVFEAEALDEALVERVHTMDIHPTGPLWGRGDPQSSFEALATEQSVMDRSGSWPNDLVDAGAGMGRRALRCRVAALQWAIGPSTLTLQFSLSRGSYATALLREILAT